MGGRRLTREEWIVLLDYFFEFPEPSHTDSHPACRAMARAIGRPAGTIDSSLRDLMYVHTNGARGRPNIAEEGRRIYREFRHDRTRLHSEAIASLARIQGS